MNKAPTAWLDGGDWFLAALVGLSGARALAGLWLARSPLDIMMYRRH